MFRKTEIAFWDSEKVVALYEGVLRRTPKPEEVEALTLALNKSGDVKRALQDMLSSHEFGIMMLPDLVNEHIARIPPKPLFYLHVPKTAGSSFRLELSDALGVPAFLLYFGRSWSGFGNDAPMHFWQFWAGHAGISAFPETHRGITVFRETRSRILSSYRQQERDPPGLKTGNRKFYDEASQIAFSRRVTAADPFSVWLSFRQSAINWFIPAPADVDSTMWHGVPRRQYIDTLSSKEIHTRLDQSLSRFDAAAWVHDPQAMRDSIRLVTGREFESGSRRENVFSPMELTKPTTLSRDDLRQLDRIAADEKLLISLAVDRGLIPPISKEKADEEFENTAKRLGFAFS